MQTDRPFALLPPLTYRTDHLLPPAAITHEEYIREVRTLAVRLLTPEEQDVLHPVKMVYGVGAKTGARGVTYFQGWAHGESVKVPLIEVCAHGEESHLQLAGTTIHELGHALAGYGHGHDDVWKAACGRLGLTLANAAGQVYDPAHFKTGIRDALLALPTPSDGKPLNGVMSANGAVIAVKVKPCSAGVGVRGGKTRGPGSGSRLRLFVCPCGIKVRVARDVWRATCGECGQAYARAEVANV